jgi:hypothetical protein
MTAYKDKVRMRYSCTCNYIDLRLRQFLALYSSQRNPNAAVKLDGNQVRVLAAIAAQSGITGTPDELLKRMRAKDRYAGQLELMAEVRAYWQVSYKVSRGRLPFSCES